MRSVRRHHQKEPLIRVTLNEVDRPLGEDVGQVLLHLDDLESVQDLAGVVRARAVAGNRPGPRMHAFLGRVDVARATA